MPDLPTISVSQAHFDRLVAAFPGATAAQKVEAYRAWLTNGLIDHVQQVEMQTLEAELNETRQQRQDALRASLPPRLPFPPSAPAGRVARESERP